MSGNDALGEWAERAACVGLDPEVFFPEAGEDQSFAMSVCADCQVRAECLAHAVANDETQGIWGGLSARERKRRAGRHLRRVA